MRDALDTTNRTRRYKLASIIASQKTRSQVVVDSLAGLIAAGGLSAIDTATFGFLNDCAATDSVSITATDRTLTSPDNPWTAADVGKTVHVAGAGAAGAVLVSRIAGFTSAGSVELADAAATTVNGNTSGATVGLCAWGWSAGVVVEDAPVRNLAGDPCQSELATAAGGSTARPLADRLADTFNVRDFGAIGDGVADDTVAIQAAINAIATGIILLPPGTYKITAALVLKTGVSLVGAGSGSTVISNAGTTDAITAGDGVSDVRSCSVRGLKVLGTVTSGRAFHGRKFGNQCVLDDVFAESGSVGFRLDSCYTAEVRNCRLYLTVGDGVQLVGGCHNTIVRRNMITGCGGHGIYVDGSYAAILNENDIEFSGKDQIHIRGASRGGEVCGNYIEGIQPTASGYAGVQVDACDSLVIRGNFFDATQTGTFGTDGTGTYIRSTAGVRILADENGFASVAASQTHVNFLVGCGNCRAKVPLGSTYANASASCRVVHDDHDERGVSTYQNAAQAFNQSAWNTVTWDTEVFDAKSEMAANAFTPKDPGIYAISVRVGVDSLAANKGAWLRLYNVTDAFEVAQFRTYGPAVASSLVITTTMVEFLSTGKAYRVDLYLDDTVNRNAIAGAATTRLSIRRIA